MNFLLIVLLLATTWFFFETGQTFIGIILGGVTAIALVASSAEGARHASSSHHAVHGEDGPVIVRSTGTKIPDSIKIRVKEGMLGTSTEEDFVEGVSQVLFWPLKLLFRILGVKRRPKPKKDGGH